MNRSTPRRVDRHQIDVVLPGSAPSDTAGVLTSEPLAMRAMRWLVMTGLVAVPIAFDVRGADVFRLPKLILFRLDTILLLLAASVFCTSANGGEMLRFLRRRIETRYAAVICAWTLVATLLSPNRSVSVGTFINVSLAASFYVIALFILSRTRPKVLPLFFVPALINAGVLLAQTIGRWDPFGNARFGLSANAGLLGNANEAGSLLSLVLIPAVAACWASRKRARVAYGLIAMTLIIALLAGQTRTAVVAVLAALLTFALMVDWRRTAILVILAVTLLSGAALIDSPVHRRMESFRAVARAHEYNVLLSGRLSAWFAAWGMVRSHPFAGIGPGRFESEYLSYRLRAERQHPSLMYWKTAVMGSHVMFSQTHNDHLQIAAEAGVPAWLLFIGALSFLARVSWRSRALNDTRGRFAFATAAPIAVTISVLTLAQFPMQLAATQVTLLWIAAACGAWSGDA